jgi:hypothetical protein
MILKKYDSKSIITKIHIIPDLTLPLKVPTASAGLLLEVPTALGASIVLKPAARVVSSVEVVAANIQHLEEVPTTSTALPMPVPMAVAM